MIEAVKPAGAVPLERFAEMEQAVGNRDGLEWRPNGVDQIGGHFDDDGSVVIVCEGDVEAKLIAPRAEAGVVSENLRIPQHGGITGDGWSPTRGPRQITEHGTIILEHILFKAGSVVPWKYHVSQEITGKRCICDVGDVFANRDFREGWRPA